MLDEETRGRIERDAITAEAARIWRLVLRTMRELDSSWPDQEEAELVWVYGPGPKLGWRIGGAIYRLNPSDLVVEETPGRRRLIDASGSVVADEAILRPELN